MSPQTHLLRPAFTEKIAQRLRTGRSVLLIGTEGQGGQRLLEDLALLSEEEQEVFQLRMEPVGSHKALLELICEQLKMEEQPSIEDALKQLPSKSWLLISDPVQAIERLVEQQAVDSDFYQMIRKANNARVAFFTEGFANRSALNLKGYQEMRLPPLSYTRIKQELERSLPRIGDHSLLTNEVYRHVRPYQLLNFLKKELRHLKEPPSAARLLELRKQFDESQQLDTPERKVQMPWWKRLFSGWSKKKTQ
ncbi:MAG: hypothetical protein AAGI38_15095 [Bacteroidota bacterium]